MSNLQTNIETLKFQLTESEAKTDKMDFCIGQRNTQLIELQEEINKKCSEVCQLERKVKKHKFAVISYHHKGISDLMEYGVDFGKDFSQPVYRPFS